MYTWQQEWDTFVCNPVVLAHTILFACCPNLDNNTGQTFAKWVMLRWGGGEVLLADGNLSTDVRSLLIVSVVWLRVTGCGSLLHWHRALGLVHSATMNSYNYCFLHWRAAQHSGHLPSCGLSFIRVWSTFQGIQLPLYGSCPLRPVQ